jgi:hypothetical protein
MNHTARSVSQRRVGDSGAGSYRDDSLGVVIGILNLCDETVAITAPTP